jgi:SNF family Na+-dependent transporter
MMLLQHLQISELHRKGIAIDVITFLILSVAAVTSAVPIVEPVASTKVGSIVNIPTRLINFVLIFIFLNFTIKKPPIFFRAKF